MSTQDEGKDTKGRSWDQVTDGTTSVATMGAGSTGDVGASAERKDPAQREQAGSSQQGGQSAGRTDDLLAGGTNDEQSDQGFQGSGANCQSGTGGANGQSGAGGSRQDEQGVSATDDDQYDQGTARKEER